MRCPRCSSLIGDDARFCPACGVELAGLLRADSPGTVPPPPAFSPLPGAYAPPPPPVHPPPSGYPAPPGTNGLAVASLVLGIIWLYWIGSLLAVIFGHVAKSQIDRSGGTQGGRGLATAGIVLGWVGLGILVVFVTVAIAAAND